MNEPTAQTTIQFTAIRALPFNQVDLTWSICLALMA